MPNTQTPVVVNPTQLRWGQNFFGEGLALWAVYALKPNVRYLLQESTDAVNWSTVQETTSGGPRNWSVQIAVNPLDVGARLVEA
jgi:hypothetical protein